MAKTVQIVRIAQEKLKKRGINEDVIRQAVEQPEEVVEGYSGRRVAHRRLHVRGKLYLLRVVFEDRPDRLVVVTAYLTSEVGRYWRGDR